MNEEKLEQEPKPQPKPRSKISFPKDVEPFATRLIKEKPEDV